MVEILATSIEDLFPELHEPKRKRIFLALLCVFSFALGLPLCLQVIKKIFSFLLYQCNILMKVNYNGINICLNL